jgi:hypothetical protein
VPTKARDCEGCMPYLRLYTAAVVVKVENGWVSRFFFDVTVTAAGFDCPTYQDEPCTNAVQQFI